MKISYCINSYTANSLMVFIKRVLVQTLFLLQIWKIYRHCDKYFIIYVIVCFSLLFSKTYINNNRFIIGKATISFARQQFCEKHLNICLLYTGYVTLWYIIISDSKSSVHARKIIINKVIERSCLTCTSITPAKPLETVVQNKQKGNTKSLKIFIGCSNFKS